MWATRATGMSPARGPRRDERVPPTRWGVGTVGGGAMSRRHDPMGRRRALLDALGLAYRDDLDDLDPDDAALARLMRGRESDDAFEGDDDDERNDERDDEDERAEDERADPEEEAE